MSKTYYEQDVYYLYIWRGEEITDELIIKGSSDATIIDKIISSTETDGFIEIYKIDKLNQKFKFHKKIAVLQDLEFCDNLIN